MKRIAAALMTFALIFALAACGAKPTEEVYNEQEAESTTDEMTTADSTTG